MTLFICREFLADLIAHPEPSFAKRALKKLVDRKGDFLPIVDDDHRHDGVDDAWIRYISTGNSAYRLIFLRKDDAIYAYRAGEHKISDHLKTPKELSEATKVVRAPDTEIDLGDPRLGDTRFLGSVHPRKLAQVYAERALVPHRSLILVSPSISSALLSPTGLVGELIDRVLWRDGAVTLLTRPPEKNQLWEFEELARRKIDVLFHTSINARLSLMEVDPDLVLEEGSSAANAAIIGSAELLEPAFALGSHGTTEELCYEVPSSDYDDAFEYCLRLVDEATDIVTYRRLHS
jgi:hypothetical protein